MSVVKRSEVGPSRDPSQDASPMNLGDPWGDSDPGIRERSEVSRRPFAEQSRMAWAGKTWSMSGRRTSSSWSLGSGNERGTRPTTSVVDEDSTENPGSGKGLAPYAPWRGRA